jgi:hypothetical protein
MMDLQTFFNSLASETQPAVICFTSTPATKSVQETYPLLFFSLLYNAIKSKSEQLISINMLDVEPDSLTSQLSISFLGSRAVYWLRAFHDLDAKKKQTWLKHIHSYTGPHQLILFNESVDWKDSEARSVIELPAMVDSKQYAQLQTFFKPDLKTSKFVTALFANRPAMSLDIACLMLEYQAVSGAGTDEFMHQWLDKIVVSEASLFTLSQHFFAKSAKSFFQLWSKIGPEYPDVFWVSFWSEQLWRAHYFVKLCKEKDMVQAKKIAFRLPFSVIQRDWRKLDLDELRNAHQALYEFDFNLKHGATSDSLELIFHKFLLGEY